MALLEKLKVVASPAAQQKTPEHFRRQKLINKLQEQLALAEGQLGGSSYSRMRWVTAVNAEGEPVRIQRPVRLKQWWAKAPNGHVLFTLRYGASPIAIANGLTAIEVGPLEELPKVISTVISAVDGGELDAELAAIAKERRFKKRPNDKKESAKK
jgi:hypothetical protein